MYQGNLRGSAASKVESKKGGRWYNEDEVVKVAACFQLVLQRVCGFRVSAQYDPMRESLEAKALGFTVLGLWFRMFGHGLSQEHCPAPVHRE